MAPRLLDAVPALLLFLLASLPGLATGDAVTIERNIPGNAHECVDGCLITGYYNLALGLACGRPFDNDCYCATASASVSVASAFLEKCVSTSCAAGDASKDRSIVRSLYGAYCLGAGYTQPGISSWVPAAATTDLPASTASETSEPSPTGNSESLPTQTQATSDGGVPTQTRATTQGNVPTRSSAGPATVTVIATPTGAPPKDNTALKIGVGVAVPVVALLAFGLGLWLWMRRRHRQNHDGMGQGNMNAPPPMQQTYYQQPPPEPHVQHYQAYQPEAGGFVRKPVPAPTVSPVSLQTKGTPGSANRPQELNSSQFAPPAATSPLYYVLRASLNLSSYYGHKPNRTTMSTTTTNDATAGLPASYGEVAFQPSRVLLIKGYSSYVSTYQKAFDVTSHVPIPSFTDASAMPATYCSEVRRAASRFNRSTLVFRLMPGCFFASRIHFRDRSGSCVAKVHTHSMNAPCNVTFPLGSPHSDHNIWVQRVPKIGHESFVKDSVSYLWNTTIAGRKSGVLYRIVESERPVPIAKYARDRWRDSWVLVVDDTQLDVVVALATCLAVWNRMSCPFS
ncbi:sugar transporter [Purpureocillium lavendulum]|uniref:Sugar transporter n=1 Tax=Purpureocillium lavendulum TaxID=1247861 RepID=A0AB34FFL0_9HYPO|nr:sugar transporter [Purpureocillium lavendulum]